MKGKFFYADLHRWQGVAIVGGLGTGANVAYILQETLKTRQQRLGQSITVRGSDQ